MSELGFEIEIKGKLFELGAEKRLRIALNQGITRMALFAEERTKFQLRKGHGVLTGHLRRSISGELVKDLVAQVDAGAVRQGANVIYASWVEGTSTRNRPGGFEGYHMFRNARVLVDREEKDKFFAEPIRKAIGT